VLTFLYLGSSNFAEVCKRHRKELEMDGAQMSMRELTDRIAKIERQNRFWRFGVIFVLVMLACSLVTAVRAEQDTKPALLRADTVEAHHFILKNADGTTVGVWSTKDENGNLTLYSATGKLTFSTEPRVAQ
jgi:hypothetical protein